MNKQSKAKKFYKSDRDIPSISTSMDLNPNLYIFFFPLNHIRCSGHIIKVPEMEMSPYDSAN